MSMADEIRSSWVSRKAGPTPRFVFNLVDGSQLTVSGSEVGWSHDPVTIYQDGVMTIIPFSSIQHIARYPEVE